MAQGGKLTVEAKLEPPADGTPPTAVISVCDTGTGIAPEDLPKIFQPFFSARKKSGLGLGLSICERIVKHHGGRIEAVSRAHQGTNFNIYLPVKHQIREEEDLSQGLPATEKTALSRVPEE
jgi:signal transduction histidine kinase